MKLGKDWMKGLMKACSDGSAILQERRMLGMVKEHMWGSVREVFFFYVDGRRGELI